MVREYRGYSKELQKWIYGYYSDERGIDTDFPSIEVFDKSNDCPISWKVNKDSVGQWIGLNDKNGNKIFEGDIVKYNKYLGIVKYGAYNCSCCSGVYGYYVESLMNGYCLPDIRDNDKLKVIGNVYEDLDTIKQQLKEPTNKHEKMICDDLKQTSNDLTTTQDVVNFFNAWVEQSKKGK